MNAAPASALELHQPHWLSRAAFQVVSILFFSTQAALALALHRGWIWLAVPLVLAVSHFMHGFLIGFHEASHGMLRKNRLFNDVEGVFIVGTDNKVSFRPVKVGIAGEKYFEVLSGLEAGERIVGGTYQAIRELKDGALVREPKTDKKPTQVTKS